MTILKGISVCFYLFEENAVMFVDSRDVQQWSFPLLEDLPLPQPVSSVHLIKSSEVDGSNHILHGKQIIPEFVTFMEVAGH